MALAFRTAVEAADHAGMVDALADDVRLHSPVAFRPFEGREAVSHVFAALLETFEDFRYTDELESDGVHALVFRARVGDKELEGLDLIRLDGDGRIRELTVMVRPASGLMALAEAMGPKVEGAKGD
jgi:SnoaL-like domain